ncbi:class I SAM-dependent methyltransferase [Anaeromyxobacter oryzisoli]|uniref:class I SAM-dependent methyltransferase n=1 Tax=Anaeromyxobacter oryzisoli TaxID=2925408 RepID=UPI001F579B99|nr:class I SAM-dependent methyltransferase [Anaeromyxobacter sp. SG63]
MQVDASAQPDRLAFVEVSSLAEYQEYLGKAGPALRNRATLERLLAAPGVPFEYLGYDACVGQFVEYPVDFDYAWQRDDDGLLLPNYRERLLSPLTSLNCRQRATVLALRHLLEERDPSTIAIYATEATTPVFGFLQRVYPKLTGSEYLGADVPSGSIRDGVRHEDVTRLTFADASFDAVVTCDVLEHVPAYEDALHEFRRVLVPGGFLLATAPFRADRHDHLIRARHSRSGDIEHLEPPEYHGDPVNPAAGILCYQHFGWKIMEDLRAAGFRSARALLVWSYFHGILGGNQILFHAVA